MHPAASTISRGGFALDINPQLKLQLSLRRTCPQSIEVWKGAKR